MDSEGGRWGVNKGPIANSFPWCLLIDQSYRDRKSSNCTAFILHMHSHSSSDILYCII